MLVFFFKNMIILVNGSPTEEIIILRGLKQGCLFPHILLLAVEQISGLLRLVIGLDLNFGFRIGS